MARPIPLLALLGLFVSPLMASASYQMFCEITGNVVSAPTFSDQIEFAFLITGTRNIEAEGLGGGKPDCHLLDGKTITVMLNPQDTVDRTQIIDGAELTLERYEIEVILQPSGRVARGIKHVHTAD